MAKRESIEQHFERWLKRHSYGDLRQKLDKAEEKRQEPLTAKEKDELKKYADLHKEAGKLSTKLEHLYENASVYLDTEELESGVNEAHDSAVQMHRFSQAPLPGRPVDVHPADIAACWGGIRQGTAFALRQVGATRRHLARIGADLDKLEKGLNEVKEQAKGRR